MRKKTATLDQQFEETLRRVRAEFERTGKIYPEFKCMTDAESFDVPVNWPVRSARGAACAALRDSFRRRGVNRYLFAGVLPTDDPNRGECVHLLAVERNGPRRFTVAEITRNEGKATLGPWQVNGDVPQRWLAELLEEGHSDRGVEAEPPPLDRVSNADLQDLADQHPDQAAEIQDSFEIHTQLGDLIADQMHNGGDGNPITIFWALESVLLSIVKDLGSPTGLGQRARFLLKDHPDKFPMFSTVPDQVPSAQRARSYVETLHRFSCEKRGVGHTSFAICLAFMNMYMLVGSQAIGALELADRIEEWDPEQHARLRQVGLRSIFESDNEQGHVVYVLSADRYPIGVIGWRNAVGDFFVSRMATCRDSDFAAAVENIKQSGAELILGSEAKELICKMEQVKGVAPRPDKSKESGK